MRFAIRIPTSNRVASRAAIIEVAQAAEEMGFYAVSVHDHLVFNGWWVACGSRQTEGGDDRDMFEALTTLSFVAARTERVRLLTAILLLPIRELVLAAKQVACLDVLSEGRVLLGVGVGSARGASDSRNEINLGAHASNSLKEYETFKVRGHRGRLVNEYLEAMREIWTKPSASYTGDFVQFQDIEVFPKPVQEGGPPILVGGASPAALRRAATYGAGWLPNALSPAVYAERKAEVQRIAAEGGRPPLTEFGLNIFTTIAESDAAALEVFEPTMGGFFGSDGLTSRNLVGAPDTVVPRLRQYAEAGVNMVEMKPIYREIPDLLRMMELVSREIMPAVAEPVAA